MKDFPPDAELTPKYLKELRASLLTETLSQRRLPSLEEFCETREEKRLWAAIKDALLTYPIELLEEIKHRYSEEPNPHTAYHVGGPLNHNLIADYFYFAPLVKSESMDQMRTLIHGLRVYPQLPPYVQFCHADDTTVQQCLALLKFTIAVDQFTIMAPKRINPRDGDTLALFLQDDGLINLAMEHYAHADLIAEAIAERQCTDIDFLRSLVAVPALGVGIL